MVLAKNFARKSQTGQTSKKTAAKKTAAKKTGYASKSVVPKSLMQVNSATNMRYATFKHMTSWASDDASENKFTIKDVIDAAATSGLNAMRSRFEEWRPYSFTVTFFPRPTAGNGETILMVTGLDLNDNLQNSMGATELTARYSTLTHCCGEGKPIRRSFIYDQVKHKQWINSHAGIANAQIANWASTVLAAFPQSGVNHNHTAFDIQLMLVCVFRGYHTFGTLADAPPVPLRQGIPAQ